MKTKLKETGKVLGADLLLLIAAAAAGVLLLWLAYCLPTTPMIKNMGRSMEMIRSEFTDGLVIDGYAGTLTGNFTDSLMLEHAVYQSPDHTRWEQMMFMYRGENAEGEGWAPGYALMDFLEGKTFTKEVEYGRYWHGYLVVLKPLLLLLDVGQIRMLTAITQLLLTGLILGLCFKRNEYYLGTAFLCSLPFLYFVSLPFSLSLSIVFTIMAVQMAVLLRHQEAFAEKNGYRWFFLFSGMAVAYFDFLTYPLVSLGIPLAACLYLQRKTWKESLRNMIVYSAQWGIGYIGLWAMKWVAGDLFAGGHVIRDALGTFHSRTGNAGEFNRLTGFVYVIKRNLSPYLDPVFILLFAGIMIWLMIRFVKADKKRKEEGKAFAPNKTGWILMLVACYVPVWFFAAENHSYEHWMFTFKIVSVSAFAGLLALELLLNPEE